jgi:uncharacterized protein
MKIVILSDIHDNVWKLEAALKQMQEAERLICCGDLCSPFIVRLLADGFPQGSLHIVFGNNDADLYRITQNANLYPDRVRLHGAFAELTLGGKRFAVNHYPEIAGGLAASGQYDVVCFGHNHRYEVTVLRHFWCSFSERAGSAFEAKLTQPDRTSSASPASSD